MSKKFRGYISSRYFMGERVPQHVQNIVLRNYCNQRNYQFFLSASEYTMNNSYIILKKTIDDISNLDGILAYSIFQMPYKDMERLFLFKKILKLNKVIHFAVENLAVKNNETLEKVEILWKIRKSIDLSIKDFNSIKEIF